MKLTQNTRGSFPNVKNVLGMDRYLTHILTLFYVSLAMAVARDVTSDNHVLLRATSPFEDMAEAALAKNERGISKSLAAADARAANVRAVISPPASAHFDDLLQKLHSAASSKEHLVLAANAVEVFRLLIDSVKPEGLKVPKEVSLLDYAGFKLHVLTSAPHPDWVAIRRTVGDADGWWMTTRPAVSDKALRDAFDSTIRGLHEAEKLESVPMLSFAAQIDLDLVDLIERYFESRK